MYSYGCNAVLCRLAKTSGARLGRILNPSVPVSVNSRVVSDSRIGMGIARG